jgi:hypothetical protein
VARASHRDPTRLLAVGFVFVVLSAATAIWLLATGGSDAALQVGMLTGALMVVTVSLYMVGRRRRPNGGA